MHSLIVHCHAVSPHHRPHLPSSHVSHPAAEGSNSVPPATKKAQLVVIEMPDSTTTYAVMYEDEPEAEMNGVGKKCSNADQQGNIGSSGSNSSSGSTTGEAAVDAVQSQMQLPAQPSVEHQQPSSSVAARVASAGGSLAAQAAARTARHPAVATLQSALFRCTGCTSTPRTVAL